MASGFCGFIKSPQSNHSAYSYDWWHTHVWSKREVNVCLLEEKDKNFSLSSFPTHFHRTRDAPFCPYRAGIVAKEEGVMCWCGVTLHRAFWEWVHALVKNKLVVPPVRTHWLKIYIKLRLTCNKIAWLHPPHSPSLRRESFPSCSSFPQEVCWVSWIKGLILALIVMSWQSVVC